MLEAIQPRVEAATSRYWRECLGIGAAETLASIRLQTENAVAKEEEHPAFSFEELIASALELCRPQFGAIRAVAVSAAGSTS